ncbi:glycoside hydrolase family 3 C-terminal domain-containing protein [Nocardia sp. NPDC004722]
MSLSDELKMVVGSRVNYTGSLPAIPALCIPALHMLDGPGGVGNSSFGVTQLPAPVNLAASWDRNLITQYGTVIGKEVAGKGANVSLGPTVNIVRDPRWGRAFESLGEDPYLAGKLGAADITAVQSQGVMAQVKHIAAYNQETNRNTEKDTAVVDTRTLQELYLPQFQDAVDAHVASAMCTYGRVATTVPAFETDWTCSHKYLLETVLHNQFGFKGFVTSDWESTHSTVNSANHGLDIEMPKPVYFGDALRAAIDSGEVSKERLDGMVHRILREMFAFGLFDKEPSGSPTANVTNPEHAATARQGAEQGTVLLKNTGVLPLNPDTNSIAVIGENAGPQTLSRGGGSAQVIPPYVVTPADGIANRAGSGKTVQHVFGPRNSGALPDVPAEVLTAAGGEKGLTAQFYSNQDMSGDPVVTRTDSVIDFMLNGEPPAPGVKGIEWSAKWTGTLTAPSDGSYTFSLSSDSASRLVIDGNTVIDRWTSRPDETQTGTVELTAGQKVSLEVDYSQGKEEEPNTAILGWQPPGTAEPLQQAVDAARNSDVAVVFAGIYEGEFDAAGGMGGDLKTIGLSDNDNKLISAVAAANPRTIVVLNTGSGITMPWLNDVAGVFEAFYPGQEYGNAIASLLFGDVNPSAKLPVTFPVSLSDGPTTTGIQWPGEADVVQYSEGSQVGYRWYDAQNKDPLFPFGFGLSYTEFEYSNLTVSGPDGDGKVTVSATVTNTGSRDGADVAQVYLGSPSAAGEPPRRLRGFERVNLQPGQSETVNFTLSSADLASWSTASNGWITPGGTYQVSVGNSSRNLPLSATFEVTGSVPAGEMVAGVAANRCVEAKDGSNTDGTPIQLGQCNGQAAQVVSVPADGTVRVLDKCIQVASGETKVELSSCGSSAAQQWQPQPNGSLKNPESGRCLDDPDSSVEPGSVLQIADCNNSAAQRWRIP